MKKSLFILLLIFSWSIISTAQTYEWFTTAGGILDDSSVAIDRDSLNNTYICGNFQDEITIGDAVFFSHGVNDIYIAKFDSSGNFLWAVHEGWVNGEEVRDILISDSSLYISGFFITETIFGDSTYTNYVDHSTYFISQYDLDGKFNWFSSENIHSLYTASGFKMAVDEEKYIWLVYSKEFSYSSRFNTSGQRVLKFYSFLDTYNSFDISIDRDSFLYTAVNDYSKGAIRKYGQVGEKKYFRITEKFFSQPFYGNIVVDSSNNLYATIRFSGTMEFGDNNEYTINSNGGYDFLLLKLDSDLNISWFKKIGSSGDETPTAVDVDKDNNLYLSGLFNDNIYIDDFLLEGTGGSGFVAKYSPEGDVLWARKVGEDFGVIPQDISVDSSGTVYMCGNYFNNTTIGGQDITNRGGDDIFIAKLGCKPMQPSPIQGDTVLCAGTYTYTINELPGINYIWQVSGGGTVSASGGEATVNWESEGVYTLTVTPVGHCGEGRSRSLEVTVKNVPEQAQINGNEYSCIGTEAYNTEAISEVEYLWQLSSGGNLFAIDNTVVVNWTSTGNHNLSLTPSNSCGTGTPANITVRVDKLPDQPNYITGETAVCSGSQNYSMEPKNNLNYHWILSSGGSLNTNENNTTINWQTEGSHALSASYSNQCGMGPSRTINVNVSTVPSQPSVINGNKQVCTGTEAYSVAEQTGVNYQWSISGGGVITGGSSGTASVTIRWTTLGTYQLTVTPENKCGTGVSRTVDISVHDVPQQINKIFGLDTVCMGNQNYMITSAEGTNYNWSLSGGGSILPEYNQALVNWQQDGSHTLTVTPYNFCGTGISKSKIVYVKDINSAVNGINGNDSVCLDEELYSVPSISGFSYVWNLSGGGSLSSSSNTAAVNWQIPGIHTLMVSTSDACTQSLLVDVADLPEQPAGITGQTEVCAGSYSYYVPESAEVDYTWSLSGGGTITNGQNTSAVMIEWNHAGSYELSVTPSNRCGNGTARSLTINVREVPGQPVAINGNETACLNAEIYQVTETDGVEYNWSINSGGVLVEQNNEATVVWQETGLHQIQVTANNICGTSPEQTLSVEVSDIPEQKKIIGETLVCKAEEIYVFQAQEGVSYLWQLNSGGSLTTENDTAYIDWTSKGRYELGLTATNHCGSTQSPALNVEVKTIPDQPAGIDGEFFICRGLESYKVDRQPYTGYSWNLTSGGVLASVENTATVNWTEAGRHTLSVTPSNMCGNGTSRTIAVQVNKVPEQPSAITGNTLVCLDEERYAVEPEQGVDYNWIISNGGSIQSEQDTVVDILWSKTGTHTLTVLPENFCGTGTARNLNIIVNDKPEKPIFTYADTSVCLTEENYTVNNQTDVNFAWNLTGGGDLISEDNTASVFWENTGNHVLSVTPSNLCGTGESNAKIINVKDAPSQPSEISGNDTTCLGSQTYMISTTAGVNYHWNLNGGGNMAASGYMANVNWITPGSYKLSVTPSNQCGDGMPRSLSVNVNDIPTQPGIISGDEIVCKHTIEKYQIPEIENIEYSWTLNGGGNLQENNNQVDIEWTNAGIYTLKVVPFNFCGHGESRTKTITVNDVPEPVIFTAGDTLVCMGNEVYSVAYQPGVDFDWNLYSGGQLESVSNTTASVKWENTGTHQISLLASNDCGNLDAFRLNVEVLDVPEQAVEVCGEDTVCTNSADIYMVEDQENATYNWNLSSGGILVPDKNQSVVTWTSPGEHILSLTPMNVCGSGLPQTLKVHVTSILSKPVFTTGEIKVCEGNETYRVDYVPGTNYQWNLSSGGNLTANENVAVVDWQESGNHNLTVIPQNACGTGPSASLSIEADVAPKPVERIMGDTASCLQMKTYQTEHVSSIRYHWQLSGGGNISTHNNKAYIDWITPGIHSLSVFPENDCGIAEATAIKIDVANVPGQPAPISGEQLLCAGNSEIYQVTALPGVNYAWSLSDGGIYEVNHNQIDIAWNKAGHHTLTVLPYNRCGTGLQRELEIKIENSIPALSGTIWGDTIAYENTSNFYSIGNENDCSYHWDLSGGGIMAQLNNGVIIEWQDLGVYELSVYPYNSCGNGDTKKIQIYIDPNPFGKIDVYPNPADVYFNIVFPVNLSWTSVDIYSSKGLKIAGYPSNGRNHLQVPVNKLSQGLYLIKIVTNSGVSTRKIEVLRKK